MPAVLHAPSRFGPVSSSRPACGTSPPRQDRGAPLAASVPDPSKPPHTATLTSADVLPPPQPIARVSPIASGGEMPLGSSHERSPSGAINQSPPHEREVATGGPLPAAIQHCPAHPVEDKLLRAGRGCCSDRAAYHTRPGLAPPGASKTDGGRRPAVWEQQYHIDVFSQGHPRWTTAVVRSQHRLRLEPTARCS